MDNRKNIILFLTDQWRWDTLGDPDHPAILPNLTAFKKDATDFTHAFTTVPLCTPARGSLFTGKLPHQNGTTDNVQGTSFYPYGKLHPSQTTYLEKLAGSGYHIAFIGKWHLGDGTLQDRGITDINLSDGGDTPIMTTADVSFDDNRKSPYYGTIVDGASLDEDRVNAAIAKLTSLAELQRPFCLVVSLHGPHFPHHVPREYVELYHSLPEDFTPQNWCEQFSEVDKPRAQSASYWPCQDTSHMTQADWRQTAQHYWGFCSYIDQLFGRFMQAITACDLDETSVLAFTSDHGEMLGAHGWFDKGPFFYEEVMRIPMIIRSAGDSSPGSVNQFVSFRDLFPTLMQRAGCEATLSVEELSRSYWQTEADCTFYVYDAYQGRQFRFRGIREKRFKYAWSPHDKEELYDLENDPLERRNLSDCAEFDATKTRLKQRLFQWMQHEKDWLAGPAYHQPVGSYIDGRDVTEQHNHER